MIRKIKEDSNKKSIENFSKDILIKLSLKYNKEIQNLMEKIQEDSNKLIYNGVLAKKNGVYWDDEFGITDSDMQQLRNELNDYFQKIKNKSSFGEKFILDCLSPLFMHYGFFKN